MSEIKCYAVALNTDEMFMSAIMGTDNKANELVTRIKDLIAGIYSDEQRGYQLLICKKEKQRDKVYKIVEEIGFDDFCKVDDIYVETKYLPKGDKDAI